MADDLNKQWAELEGYLYLPKETTDQHDGYVGWVNSNGVEVKLPDWTGPNNFFDKVVPKMIKLGFSSIISIGKAQWSYEFYRQGSTLTFKSKDKEIGKAGLTTAIQARKNYNDSS